MVRFYKNPDQPLTREKRVELLERLYTGRIEPVSLVYDLPYREKKLFNLKLTRFVLEQEEWRGNPLPSIFYDAYEQAMEWFPEDPFDFPETARVRSFYMKKMDEFIPDYLSPYDYEEETRYYAMLAVRNATVYGVLTGLAHVPFLTVRYLQSRAKLEGASAFEINEIGRQEVQRQIQLMIDILEKRPVRRAMELWQAEAEERLYNPTLHFHTKKMRPKQKEALWRAEDELAAAGLYFDTGYAFDSGTRDWQWDWSLEGPASVTIHDREWLDASAPKVNLREMPDDWPEKRKRKKRKQQKRAANPFPDPNYPRTFEELVEEGYSPVTPPDYYMRHFYGRVDNPNYTNPDRDPGDFMTLKDVLAFEPLAKSRGVSEVARSAAGFLGQYKRVRGNPKALETLWYSERQSWMRRRNNFVKRHMAQVEKQGEPLWEKNGNPTRRHLALIMWAYTPDPAGVRAWIRENR